MKNLIRSLMFIASSGVSCCFNTGAYASDYDYPSSDADEHNSAIQIVRPRFSKTNDASDDATDKSSTSSDFGDGQLLKKPIVMFKTGVESEENSFESQLEYDGLFRNLLSKIADVSKPGLNDTELASLKTEIRGLFAEVINSAFYKYSVKSKNDLSVVYSLKAQVDFLSANNNTMELYFELSDTLVGDYKEYLDSLDAEDDSNDSSAYLSNLYFELEESGVGAEGKYQNICDLYSESLGE